MILDYLEVIDIPDDEWLTRLRHNHFVWADKERCFAKIIWAWEPPDPGCVAGRIGISFCWRDGDGWRIGPCHSWYVKPDGKGFDGLPLLLPVKDNCPDEPREISEPWVRQMERTIARLTHRVEQLENNGTNIVMWTPWG